MSNIRRLTLARIAAFVVAGHLLHAGCAARHTSETATDREGNASELEANRQGDQSWDETQCESIPACNDLGLRAASTAPMPPPAMVRSDGELLWTGMENREGCDECPRPYQVILRGGDGELARIPTAVPPDVLAWVEAGARVRVEALSHEHEGTPAAMRLTRAEDAALILHIESSATSPQTFDAQVAGARLTRDPLPVCDYRDELSPDCTLRFLVDALRIESGRAEPRRLPPGEATEVETDEGWHFFHHHYSEHHNRELGQCGDTGCAPGVLDRQAFEVARAEP